MHLYDIVSLGEILIDYTPMPPSARGMQVFEQNAGGAPANVLACAAKLGGHTAFIGKIGTDLQGEFLQQTLTQAGIETKGLVATPDYFTTLAFVSLGQTGERSFAFARKYSADIMLCKEEVDCSLLASTKIFHFGSLSLTHPCCKEATLFALAQAKQQGAIISYDPNYRPLLWENEATATETMRSVLPSLDLIKLSEEEIPLLTDATTPAAAAKQLLAKGVQVVLITLGAQGAFIATAQGSAQVAGYPAHAIDTTGAGDCFWGAMLQQIAESGLPLAQLSLATLRDFTDFANVAASLCVQQRGAIAAMPTRAQVLAVQHTDTKGTP